MSNAEIQIKCGIQQSVMTITELYNGQLEVDCQFFPPLDFEKTPTRDENFVANLTARLLYWLKGDKNVKN